MTDLEKQLASATFHPQSVAALAVDPTDTSTRMSENLLSIHAELEAPREPRLARMLRRLGVPDLSVPLVSATPALRRSWFIAIAIAVFFALTAATNNSGVGVDRISVFLTLAPLVPLLGVALAFGNRADPTHDLVVAAPRDTFTVFLIRTVTVLAASSVVLLVTSAMLPTGGFYRLAWLAPAVAVTAMCLALSSRFAPRRVAAGVAITWLAVVIIISSAASVADMFGPVTQVVAVGVAVASVAFVASQRERFETVEVSA